VAGRLTVGPLLVEVTLAPPLEAPAGWREAFAGADVAGADVAGPGASERLELVLAAEDGGASSEIRLFDDDGAFSGGGCRLRREILPAPRGDVRERVTGVVRPHASALARAFRFATQPRLAALGWMLLHGSSVALADGVHVFVAASGTGKSTLARRLVAHGARLVGDEVALVHPDGRVAAHPGQPVHGPLGRTERLAAVHLLGRGEPSTRRAAGAGAVATLLAQAMVYEARPAAAVELFAQLARLVETVAVFETTVPDGPAAARLFGLGGGAA
jgi:hypothetical protein